MLLCVDDLSVGYDKKPVATGLTFSVYEGDYLCIVGENGSGKSTLMKTLLGLTPPLGGAILAGDGNKLNGIGYLPQQTNAQRDFPASVREIVLSGCQAGRGFAPFYNRADKERARKNMQRMGIEDLSDKPYRNLSGEQQQRVLLARALCAAKQMLLLDEPVAGLDPMVTEDMYELISRLNKDGIAIMMITHDVSAACRYADNILHIGRNVFFGSKDEYLESDIGRRYTLGEGEA